MAHLHDGDALLEILYRKDPELARAITLRHMRLIRRLRDRLSEFISEEQLRAILGEEDLEGLDTTYYRTTSFQVIPGEAGRSVPAGPS